MRFSPLVVYRWPDGGFAEASVDRDSDHVVLLVVTGGQRWVSGPLLLDPETRSAYSDREEAFLPPVEKRVTSFLLDLGVERCPAIPGLVNGDRIDLAVFPLFVADDLWERRHEEARQVASGLRGDFLGLGRASSEWDRKEEQVRFTVHIGNMQWDQLHHTVEEAVDDIVVDAVILPESTRSAWFAEHVERGEWVHPSPEEVEVYQALGEELPFWWGPDRFEAWLRERS